MKFKLYFLFVFLTCIVTDVCAQYVSFNLTVKNRSSGGDGSNAVQGQWLSYTMAVKNLTASPITGVKLIADIPYGTYYLTGYTWQNGVIIPDVSGNMPYAAPSGGVLGTLAAGATVTVEFYVKITSLGGNITNHAIFKGVQGGGNLYETATPTVTRMITDVQSFGFYGLYTGALLINASTTYPQIRTFDFTTGLSNGTTYFGTSSTGICLEVGNSTPLTPGTLLRNGRGLAYDKRSKRLYYTNSTTEENLAYIDLTASPQTANIYPAGPYILEPGATSTGQIITRMCFSADDIGYALTDNGGDLVRFEVPASGTAGPVITNLGSLINAPSNGTNDVLAESEGDIFAEGNGNLMLITGSAKFYRISPATRVATYLGTITNLPTGYTVMGAMDGGDEYYGGPGIYLSVLKPLNVTTKSFSAYKVDVPTMSATLLSSNSPSTSAIDYAGGGITVYSHYITCFKSAEVTGNYIDYTIEVTNSGAINAPGVSLYDPIPDHSDYVTGSTTINDQSVADVAGEMPFAVSGGTFITAGDAPGIIKPGKVTIKFRVQRQSGWDICHSAQLSYYDMNNNPVIVPIPSAVVGQVVSQTCVSPDARRARVDTPYVNGVQVGPNPFANNLSVQVTLVKDETVLVRLTNLQGRVVYSKVERLSTGVNNLNITPALPQGIYVIEILAGTKRLYKQKLEKL